MSVNKMSQLDREKWDCKYADPDAAPVKPSPSLLRLEQFIPESGRALDVAGGAGRHSIWLAQRGMDVTLADVSRTGLEIARRRASEANVSIQLQRIDLESEVFPVGPWDLVLSHYYFCRDIFPAMIAALASDGRLIVVQPTVRNLERNAKPPRPFLFDEAELPTLAQGLEVLRYVENWNPENYHEAVLVARKLEFTL